MSKFSMLLSTMQPQIMAAQQVTEGDSKKKLVIFISVAVVLTVAYIFAKYSLQGTTQGRYLTGGVPPVRFSM